MPLNFTAAHTSRITKPKSKTPLLKRTSSSPFAAHPRRKPTTAPPKRQKSCGEDGAAFEDALEDRGLITSLADDLNLRDGVQIIRYVQETMFGPVPDRGGMNSTRIADVLNFRRSLPPIVTTAHVHALTRSPTASEKDIADLQQKGVIRKITIPGRGAGGAGVAEGLVLMQSWKDMVNHVVDLPEELRARYVDLLLQNPTASRIRGDAFSTDEAASLMRHGFLTSSTQPMASADLYLRPGPATLGTLASVAGAGSRSASGSTAAGGSDSVVHTAGGGAGSLHTTSLHTPRARGDFNFSLPCTGPYLRLLTDARAHLLSLLSKSKYRESPKDMLQERWDGGIDADDAAARARMARGEHSGVLPGRTKKWKQFYGLRFQWVLAECLGAGLVEVFDTGSVGLGVRLA